MAFIVYTVLFFSSFIFLVLKKNEDEAYFPLKIIGYFICGSFAFHFNGISLPIGFLVYLLFFRPTLHVHVKRMAAILGLLTFILVHWIIPFTIQVWENRAIFIEQELDSVYSMNFENEYEKVTQGLKLNDSHDIRLEDFEVDYVKDGRITDLSWQFLSQNGNSYYLYQIHYEIDKSRYRVTKSKLDTWLQYNRLIEAATFFEILSTLNIKDITHSKGDYLSYVIRGTGERVNYGVENQPHYIVSNGVEELLADSQLPVEAYVITTFAMKKTREIRDERGNIKQEEFEGTEMSDYLFEVSFSSENN